MRHLTATLILLVTITLANGATAAPLRISTRIKPPLSTAEQTGFFDLLIKELCAHNGLTYQFVRQPPDQALSSVNNGTNDIALPRIAGMEILFPNLIMVPESVLDYYFVAFANDPFEIHSFDDLEGKRVGYIRGWKIYRNNTPINADVERVDNVDTLFDRLSQRHLDVALYERYGGEKEIASRKHSTIRELSPPLAVKPMYMYLNKKDAVLAETLANSLKKMKQDGTYQKIWAATLGSPDTLSH